MKLEMKHENRKKFDTIYSSKNSSNNLSNDFSDEDSISLVDSSSSSERIGSSQNDSN